MTKCIKFACLLFVFTWSSPVFSQVSVEEALAAEGRSDEDRGELNRRFKAALRPGGVYGIIDHHAADGAGTSVIESLHRIEASVIVDEISGAGFELAASGDFLSTPEDDRSLRVFDPSIRGNTDRFVLRFEKP